jgi:hypothetical protein
MYFHPFVQSPYLSHDYKELLKGLRNITVELTALTLGLLIAQALSSYERKSDELKNQASYAISFNRALIQFGSEVDAAMIGLRKTINDEIKKITLASQEGEAAQQEIGRSYMDRLRPLLSKLEPKNE